MKKKFALFCCVAYCITCLLLSGCSTPNTSSGSSSTNSLPQKVTASEPVAEPDSGNSTISEQLSFNPDTYTDITTNVPFIDDTQEHHQLDLYGVSSSEVKPTIIEVHGGGFVGGTRDNNKEHCIFFAQQGYKVVATDYDRVPREGSFKNAIQDLFTSYQWVAEHADEYGFDLSNIILSGDSAGGYYVLLTCAIFHSEELQEYFDVTVPEYSFNGYVTTCPLADIRSMQEDLNLESGPNAHIAQSIGADILMDEDLISHMDLMQAVPAEAFEGLYMLTTPGDNVTGKTVLTFDKYLTEHNVSHCTVSYEGQENELGHTFNISHWDYPESIAANHDMVAYCNTLLK